jgi:hypothetical protein
VAILPALSKVLETVVRDALLSWFKQTNFLPEAQYGFQPGKSVAMALTVAQTDWINAKASNELVGIMAFDLSAAFDTLEHLTSDALKIEPTTVVKHYRAWFDF